MKNKTTLKRNKLNPERKPLTLEKLRELSGMKELSEVEAEKIIHSIRLFVKVLHELQSSEKLHIIDNQQDVYLDTLKKAA